MFLCYIKCEVRKGDLEKYEISDYRWKRKHRR